MYIKHVNLLTYRHEPEPLKQLFVGGYGLLLFLVVQGVILLVDITKLLRYPTDTAPQFLQKLSLFIQMLV